MNDNECEDTYHQLVSIMADWHMEWVAKDAEASIHRNEVVFDEISSEDHEQLTLFKEATFAKKASLPKKTSAAQKRLLVLIDNMYHALVNTAECQHFLLRSLNRKGIRGIIFLSPDGEGRKLALEQESIREQLRAARQLGHVLQSLRDVVVEEA